MYSIEVNNLTKKFGKFTSVNSVSFNVLKGEIFGLLGANGAGKSTTIRMLCGILKPTSGDAIVSGFSINNEYEAVKKNIGYMSQKFSLYNDLTVEENINFFGGVYGIERKKLEERKKWVLKVAHLQGKENLLTGSLPVGIKQRLALGTAVVHEPKVLFLDEPTGGVDPISRRNFWDLINDLSSAGMTIIVTTHYLDEAEFCNTIVMMNTGKIIAKGSSSELKRIFLNRNIFEIECTYPLKAMQTLENSRIADDTSLFGNFLHITLKSNKDNEITILKILSTYPEIKIFRLEKYNPSLEDVFIYLLKKDEQINK